MQTCVRACLANLRPFVGLWRGLAPGHLIGRICPHDLLLSSIMPSGPVGNVGSNCGCPELCGVVRLAEPMG